MSAKKTPHYKLVIFVGSEYLGGRYSETKSSLELGQDIENKSKMCTGRPPRPLVSNSFLKEDTKFTIILFRFSLKSSCIDLGY